MLALWGQVCGVMHILRMRQEGFGAAFGISRETRFVHFLDMRRAALRGPASAASNDRQGVVSHSERMERKDLVLTD